MCRGNGCRAGRARNPTDLSSRVKRESRKIFGRGLGRHQNFLISQVRRRGPLGGKCQLQVMDDPVHYGVVREESDDLHRAAALRTDHRVDLIDLADHLGPALGRERPELLLNHPEGKRPKACLLDLPSMGVGGKATLSIVAISWTLIRGWTWRPSLFSGTRTAGSSGNSKEPPSNPFWPRDGNGRRGSLSKLGTERPISTAWYTEIAHVGFRLSPGGLSFAAPFSA